MINGIANKAVSDFARKDAQMSSIWFQAQHIKMFLVCELFIPNVEPFFEISSSLRFDKRNLFAKSMRPNLMTLRK